MPSPFHSGEREVQRRAGVADEADAVGRIVGRTITPAAGRFLARQRLAAAATVDARGRVWASLLTGAAGFIAADGPERLRVAAQPIGGDPLASNLAAGGRRDVGLVVLDPHTRQRMRFNGVGRFGGHNDIGRFDGNNDIGRFADRGLLIDIRQAYGNCPKYIQLREPLPDAPSVPQDPRVAGALDERQRAWIAQADTLFIASFHPEGGADASHRGGMPGFVRVHDSDRLSFPDYSGNAMFNTLGNLVEYPQAGLLFVDFTSGNVLQLTGGARLEDDRSVVFDIGEVRETRGASPLRLRLVEYSPANPRMLKAAIQSR